MSDLKKYLSSPLVVSTDCSRFKSFCLTCCRCVCNSKPSPNSPPSSHHNPISLSPRTNLHSPNCFRDGKEAAQAYWRRTHQLEQELIQLDKWIDIEKNLRECINVTQLAKLDRQRTSKKLVRAELMRLANGGYIYDIKKICRSWGTLTMQVSAPAVIPADTGSNASQVLHRMALMGTGNLRNWLLESLPMDDIWSDRMEEKERSRVSPGSEEGFMEAIVMGAMGKIETLVIQGLRLHMGKNERAQNAVILEKREEIVGECIILAMLIQLRDPEKEYEAVGDILIGLVEASVAEVEACGFHIEGVHVAGMPTCFKENKQSFQTQLLSRREVKSKGNYMWSISVTDCKGRCSCNCQECVRNPDIVVAA